MNMMNRFYIILLLSFVTGPLSAQEWLSADDREAPMEERLMNKDYKVEINTDGYWKPLEVFGALTSASDFINANYIDTEGKSRSVMGFSMFTHDFETNVRVRVKRIGKPFTKVDVRPHAYGIKPKKVDSNTVEFTLTSPKQKVSVEFDNDRQSNFFLFPDLPTSRPDGYEVIYYGPGNHYIGELRLNSNQALYLDKGAIIFADIRSENAENIMISGYGIICGSRQEHDLKKRKRLFEFVNCKNVILKDVIVRDSPSWTTYFSECDGVHIDNVKHITWMINSDGFDFCNTRNVLMENCFIRNYDDNVSLKAFKGGSDTYNITVRDCVMWADCAHNFLVGPETPGRKIHNIRFQNSIILESREDRDPWRGAMAVMISDDGTYEDIYMEDIRIEDIRGGALMSFDYGIYNTFGLSAKNIVVRNISYSGPRTPKSIVKGRDENHIIENIIFENVVINGEKLREDNFNKYFISNEFIKGLTITH